MFDVAILKRVITVAESSFDADLISNVVERTFPKGQSVEVIRGETLTRSYPKYDAHQREHVTPFFYSNREFLNIVSVTSGRACGSVSMVVDTEEEYESFVELVKQMKRPHWEYGWQELLALRSDR